MHNKDLIIQYIINKSITQKLKERKENFYVQMNVTNKCSDNCFHCYLKGKHFISDEVSALDFIEIIEQVDRWANKKSKRLVIDLIGGDPLCKADINMILEYLFSKKIIYGLKGNPYLLLDKIEYLKSLNCSSYQMSLDGLEETHDLLRSEGSYKSTLAAIKLLNIHHIPVNIKFTLSGKNVHDLWPLLYKLYEEGVKIASFSVARYYEKDGNGFHVSEEYYDESLKKLIDFYSMQIENNDIRIFINLKEHLWIPYLAKKEYLLADFYKLVDDTPYLSSCSMLSMNSTFITSDGYYDVCPKIPNFGKEKNFDDYMEKKNKFLNKVKDTSCIGCSYRKMCLGCLAFHMPFKYQKDCDCFLF